MEDGAFGGNKCGGWIAPVPGRLPPQRFPVGCVPGREGPPGLVKASATCQNRVNKGGTTIPSMLGHSGVTAGGGCAAPAWWARDLGRHPSLSFRRGLRGCEREMHPCPPRTGRAGLAPPTPRPRPLPHPSRAA